MNANNITSAQLGSILYWHVPRDLTFPVEQVQALANIHGFDSDDFKAQVIAHAKEFTPPNKAARAVGHIKRAVQSGAEVPLEYGLAIERELQAKLFASGDAKIGLNAYVEKQKPEFKGS